MAVGGAMTWIVVNSSRPWGRGVLVMIDERRLSSPPSLRLGVLLYERETVDTIRVMVGVEWNSWAFLGVCFFSVVTQKPILAARWLINMTALTATTAATVIISESQNGSSLSSTVLTTLTQIAMMRDGTARPGVARSYDELSILRSVPTRTSPKERVKPTSYQFRLNANHLTWVYMCERKGGIDVNKGCLLRVREPLPIPLPNYLPSSTPC